MRTTLGGGQFLAVCDVPPRPYDRVAGWLMHVKRTSRAKFNFHYTIGTLGASGKYTPVHYLFHTVSGSDTGAGGYLSSGKTAVQPVSRIRVILEKVRILNDHDPWIKGRGEFHSTVCVSFNDDPCRHHWYRVPQKGHYKISDWPKCNEQELNLCVYDGYVAEDDNMSISVLPIEEDWLDPDDELSLYRRQFNGPPETWVGVYSPEDEPPESELEKQSDWMLWYRIESIKL